MTALPKVMLVGGPDIDARLELMHCLKDNFEMGALGSQPALSEKFLREGFTYTPYRLSREPNPFSDIVTVSQLVSIFRRLRPQVVHTFDTKPGIWGVLAARLASVPIIISTVTGLGSLYANDSLTTRAIRTTYQTLQKLVCQLSALTIFQNQADAHQFITARVVPEQKAIVIPGSGVSTSLFAPDRVTALERTQVKEGLGLKPGEIVVTMISRVIRSKGVLEFMTAAQNVSLQHPEVRFLLVGPEDKGSVDPLTPAELAQLRESVIWPGSRRDIPAILAISDIFVFPSTYREGIPRVLLEAASMGLPLVTTDSPGCNEVVENKVNGFLVPGGESKGLCQAILNLVDRPELRQQFGLISRQRAVERFDLSIIADQTRKTYQRFLAQKALSPVGVA
jgi:glycosyltransferase involved in cell wall biosynthesis